MAGLWRKVRENRDLSAISAISNVIRTVATVGVFALTALAGAFIFPTLSVAIAAGAAGCACVAAAVWLYIALRNTAKARKGDWNPHIWVKERTCHCYIASPTRAEYRNHLKVKVLKKGITEFNWRFNWTGEGPVSVEVKNKNITHILEDVGEVNSHAIRIQFDKPWPKGHEGVIEFTIKTEGLERPQRPFSALSFLESRMPLEVDFVVEFGNEVEISAVHKEVYQSPKVIWPLDPPEPVTLGRDRTVRWPIKPRREHRYSITWAYA